MDLTISINPFLAITLLLGFVALRIAQSERRGGGVKRHKRRI